MPVTNMPVPVPWTGKPVVVAVPLDQKAVVFRGKGKRTLLEIVAVGNATGAVVRVTPVPVVSITPVPVPVPVPWGRKVVDVPLDHGAVAFRG